MSLGRDMYIRPCPEAMVVTAGWWVQEKKAKRKARRLGSTEMCVAQKLPHLSLHVKSTLSVCDVWPYDRWPKELVAAGRLPGDIAEEMNGRLAYSRG